MESNLLPSFSRVLSGVCPDEKCGAKLFFPSYDSSVECTSCGQRHEQNVLLNLEEVTNPNVALRNFLRNVLVSNSHAKRGAEMVKVRGLSNYHCKLLSPFLTYYGMDRNNWKACLLKNIKGQGELFDCSLLSDRTFLIDPEHMDIVGYGRDVSGSASYLSETLNLIKECNDNEERLIPIHADGDGHCLVHAVSRTLVGRELFWHPLRVSLKRHLEENIETYKSLLREFIDDKEWKTIIEECDPDYQPPEGEVIGLRNIHVFGLANVLHRPIILLDSLSGMMSSGDYSALFLPALIPPEKCRRKKEESRGKKEDCQEKEFPENIAELNMPICIAWSSSGRNHFIPLVGVKNESGHLPKLPKSLLPKPWGINESLVDQYLEFDENNCCTIGGNKCLPDYYILKLAAAMEEVYMEKYGVHPSVVADVHHYVYKRTGFIGVLPKEVLATTQKAIEELRLYRCLLCNAVCEQHLVSDWFVNNGVLYKLAENHHGKLREDKLYTFPIQGFSCTYDATKDELVPDLSKSVLEKCSYCRGGMRLVKGDGTVQYQNGDRTSTVCQSNTCNCGHKHFWDGKEYENLPQMITVTLDWMGSQIEEQIPWFQYENDKKMNSNAYEVANGLIQKHFPGVFGIERLAQKVVDQILEKTKSPQEMVPSILHEEHNTDAKIESPSKIIITGFKTLHKEELTKSETERMLRQKIVTNAVKNQRRTSAVTTNFTTKIVTPSKVMPKTPTTSRASPKHHLQETHIQEKSIKTSTRRMIRVSTSDGNQVQLSLESITTLDDLRNELEIKLGIPVARQKILFGFPPRELSFSVQDGSKPHPFYHGDRLWVEILPDNSDETTIHVSDDIQTTTSEIGSILSSDTGRDTLAQSLTDMQNSDRLDAAVASLALAASISDQSLWSYVQTLPNLFLPQGLFYQQVERDIGLIDGKHCHLPYLIDKVFVYNKAENRIEICLEPYGHFPITPGVVEKHTGLKPSTGTQNNDFLSILSSSFKATASEASTTFSSTEGVGGTSGVFVSKSKEILSTHTPFQGQGYSLGGKTKARNFDGDLEEMEKSKLDHWNSQMGSAKFMLKRTKTAPGVSVLSSSVSEGVNKLQSLAKSLEESFSSQRDVSSDSFQSDNEDDCDVAMSASSSEFLNNSTSDDKVQAKDDEILDH